MMNSKDCKAQTAWQDAVNQRDVRAMCLSAVLVALPLALTACSNSNNSSSTEPVAGPAPRVTKFIVKDPQLSAAFLDVQDLNGDGVKEIVLSSLIERNVGPPNATSRGALRIFESSTGELAGPWDET